MLVIGADACEFLLGVFDVRAVHADKHDQRTVASAPRGAASWHEVGLVGAVVVPGQSQNVVSSEGSAGNDVDQLKGRRNRA